MEYTNIIAAVPAGEHFDASAVNEGVWMSVAHLNSIEAVMATFNTQLDDQALQAQQAVEANGTLTDALNTANATIEERNAEIASLQQQIADLKAAPAAPITQTTKEGDEFEKLQVQESEITREARLLREKRDGKKL